MYFLGKNFWSAEVKGDVPKTFQSNNSNLTVTSLVGGYKRCMVLRVFYVVLFTNRMSRLNTNMLSVLW